MVFSNKLFTLTICFFCCINILLGDKLSVKSIKDEKEKNDMKKLLKLKMYNTCKVGTIEPIWEDDEITESYCRCLDGSYGLTCQENFYNPCVDGQVYHKADPSIPKNYFIECNRKTPYLMKCAKGTRWNQMILTCVWDKTDTYINTIGANKYLHTPPTPVEYGQVYNEQPAPVSSAYNQISNYQNNNNNNKNNNNYGSVGNYEINNHISKNGQEYASQQNTGKYDQINYNNQVGAQIKTGSSSNGGLAHQSISSNSKSQQYNNNNYNQNYGAEYQTSSPSSGSSNYEGSNYKRSSTIALSYGSQNYIVPSYQESTSTSSYSQPSFKHGYESQNYQSNSYANSNYQEGSSADSQNYVVSVQETSTQVYVPSSVYQAQNYGQTYNSGHSEHVYGETSSYTSTLIYEQPYNQNSNYLVQEIVYSTSTSYMQPSFNNNAYQQVNNFGSNYGSQTKEQSSYSQEVYNSNTFDITKQKETLNNQENNNYGHVYYEISTNQQTSTQIYAQELYNKYGSKVIAGNYETNGLSSLNEYNNQKNPNIQIYNSNNYGSVSTSTSHNQVYNNQKSGLESSGSNSGANSYTGVSYQENYSGSQNYAIPSYRQESSTLITTTNSYVQPSYNQNSYQTVDQFGIQNYVQQVASKENKVNSENPFQQLYNQYTQENAGLNSNYANVINNQEKLTLSTSTSSNSLNFASVNSLNSNNIGLSTQRMITKPNYKYDSTTRTSTLVYASSIPSANINLNQQLNENKSTVSSLIKQQIEEIAEKFNFVQSTSTSNAQSSYGDKSYQQIDGYNSNIQQQTTPKAHMNPFQQIYNQQTNKQNSVLVSEGELNNGNVYLEGLTNTDNDQAQNYKQTHESGYNQQVYVPPTTTSIVYVNPTNNLVYGLQNVQDKSALESSTDSSFVKPTFNINSVLPVLAQNKLPSQGASIVSNTLNSGSNGLSLNNLNNLNTVNTGSGLLVGGNNNNNHNEDKVQKVSEILNMPNLVRHSTEKSETIYNYLKQAISNSPNSNRQQSINTLVPTVQASSPIINALNPQVTASSSFSSLNQLSNQQFFKIDVPFNKTADENCSGPNGLTIGLSLSFF